MPRVLLFLTLTLTGFIQSAFEVDVNLVNVFATVQDADGRYVTGLDRDDFRIIEDGTERRIEIFETTGNMSSSVGVLIDNSGSSASILGSIKSGVESFSKKLGPDDETFVMSFAIQTEVIHDFDGDIVRLPDALRRLRSWGTSVLFDALADGIIKVDEGRHERKALIVLSDGSDNRSSVPYRDVVNSAKSNIVLLYFIGIGPRVLIDTHTIEGLASTSGGRVIMLGQDQSVPDALEEIRQELNLQYYLGYHASGDPGFHSIQVEVPTRAVTVRARNGYVVD